MAVAKAKGVVPGSFPPPGSACRTSAVFLGFLPSPLLIRFPSVPRLFCPASNFTIYVFLASNFWTSAPSLHSGPAVLSLSCHLILFNKSDLALEAFNWTRHPSWRPKSTLEATEPSSRKERESQASQPPLSVLALAFWWHHSQTLFILTGAC